MASLILFVVLASSLLPLLALAADSGMTFAGITTTTDNEAIQAISIAWNISDWKPYIGSDPCVGNGNSTPWPYIGCDGCHLGASSNSCNVTSLNLNGQNINAKIPPELFNLQLLTHLDLHNNSISDNIPPAIGSLSKIAYLDLSMNNFSGHIPEEISNLTGLTHLNLSKNLLSGSVPSKLGDITSLSYLDLSVNMLSGNVPSELGKLTKLLVLKFGTNSFKGLLPPDLGNLSSLEQLYFDSSRVSGLLHVLEPLTKLRILRIYGTSIEGPIPNFSLPSTIRTLQIGDLLPPSVNSSSQTERDSDFSFLKNMHNLTILSLRNCSLKSINFPNIPVLTNLTYLDLSFNKLSGKVPTNFAQDKFPNLTQLFIGGNKFDGNLNDILPRNLSNGEIDVSFNPISGDLSLYPNLNINFLGTNIDARTRYSNSRSSDIVNFIGNKSLWTNITKLAVPFAIKCGGDVHDIPHLFYYHNDTKHLGVADLNFDPQNQWVVSIVSPFLPNNYIIDFIVNTDHSISGAETQALYQTARISASSLRYYIVGFPDGDGYKIEIDFAEIVIEEQSSWRGLGRRYFNIYIQGKPVEEDFNIVDAANGSYVVVNKTYENITVTNKTLDIHFQWAGRGTCCVPHEDTYGPLVSAIRVSTREPPPRPRKTAREKAGVAVGILSLGIASLLISLSIVYLWWQWIRLGRVMKP
ncbi:Leucine-rich repeat transmembrane protein kinase [Rhynchospora pubera]|uniref:non-specific serine/threonine protein kinase n=1 Tax=Rhynchospora pubera TaxID=906938 RepID=A0AAV8CHV6_9POAL|nr:Leucine-rich repeat transmembrane protein kinase [Rhynchospora pubera]